MKDIIEMKPKVFVAYSKEAHETATAIAAELGAGFDVDTWQQAFGPTESLFESLVRKARECDFGIFVFSTHDFVKAKGKIFLSSNVIFELGLFLGTKGTDRCFIIMPKGRVELPSDLKGLIYSTFDPDAKDRQVSVRHACTEIKAKINSIACGNCYFISNQKSAKCMDVEDWKTGDGSKVIQWPYHGGKNQLWMFQKLGDGTFGLISQDSSKCLQVANRRKDEGAPAELGTFKSAPHQRWHLTKLADGAYKITNKHSSMCLTTKDGSNDNRAPIVQHTWEDNASFKWWLGINVALD